MKIGPRGTISLRPADHPLRLRALVRTLIVLVSLSAVSGLPGAATEQSHVSSSPATDAGTTSSSPTLPRVDRGFRWGVASSAFQSEGGRLPSNWHKYAQSEEPYLNSVDFRHRYPADIRRAKELGVNTYRIGINWARVEPRPGVINKRGLRFYDDVVHTIRANGMQPLITLDHFVYPQWVLDQGAWDNPKTVDDFVRFAKRIVRRYQDDVRWWIVFNEPFCYVAVETGRRRMTPVQVALMYDHLVAAHRRVYNVVHAANPRAMVSSNECTPSLAEPERWVADALFLDRVEDRIDYVGIDYYYRDIRADLITLMSGDIWNIPLDPAGLYPVLTDYHERYPSLPIVVTENGMATDNGKPRSDGWTRSGHLQDNIYWMQRAIEDGVPVRGYFYWSLTDNYEWGSYRPRFGLYKVNVTTDKNLVRHPTAAVKKFKTIIRRGGMPSSYLPPGSPH